MALACGLGWLCCVAVVGSVDVRMHAQPSAAGGTRLSCDALDKGIFFAQCGIENQRPELPYTLSAAAGMHADKPPMPGVSPRCLV